MRTLAIFKKVTIELLRDKRTLALIFAAPILIMWLMNIMFSANTSVTVNLATVNIAQTINTELDNLDNVNVSKYDDFTSAKDALDQHTIDAIVKYDEHNGYEINYANIDSSKTAITRQVVKNIVTADQTKSLLDNAKKLLPANTQGHNTISFTEHYNYGNEDTGFFSKMVPVLIGFITFFFVFLISGMALLKERTTGTLNRLLATPVKRYEIVFGYMLAYGIVAIIQTSIISFSAIWLMNIEVVGNLGYVICINIILALVALAFGFLMSTIAKSEFQMIQLIPIIVMPQLFFSGLIPLNTMPNWVQYIGKILPLSYSGDSISKVILEGKGLTDISTDVIILLVFLIILTIANILGLKKYRKV